MIVPIVRADPERHGRFIFGTWCISAGEPREKLHRLLRRGEARAVVMDFMRNGPDGKPLFAGWAAVLESDPQQVVWAYTKPVGRDGGCMVALLTALGCDTGREMVALFPCPVADTLRRRGWLIKYPKEIHARSETAEPQEPAAG